MPITDLLVYIDNHEDCENTILAALHLAEKYDAHLTALYVIHTPHLPIYSGIETSITAAAIEIAEENIRKQANITKAKFEKLTHAWQCQVEWREVVGDPKTALIENAIFYDLIIFGQVDPNDKSKPKQRIMEQVALACGRPVLVIPYGHKKPLNLNRVLVAWNATRESTRATHDALPFLSNSESVDIVAVNPSREFDIPCIEIAQHLSRHGVVVETESAYAYRHDVGKQILTLATTFDADMIVIGAYGHSRLTNMIFGGVTQYIMDEMKIPVLMSH